MKRYNWLAGVINKNKYKLGAEVGVATGITTEFILKYSPSLRSLYVADDWRPVGEPGHRWAVDNMEELFRSKFQNDNRVKILKGLSWEMAEKIQDRSLDFVFIDASHDYESVKKDIAAWEPKVKRGCLLCGHDINLEGVKKAVEEKFGKYNDAKVDHVWFVIV